MGKMGLIFLLYIELVSLFSSLTMIRLNLVGQREKQLNFGSVQYYVGKIFIHVRHKLPYVYEFLR